MYKTKNITLPNKIAQTYLRVIKLAIRHELYIVKEQSEPFSFFSKRKEAMEVVKQNTIEKPKVNIIRRIHKQNDQIYTNDIKIITVNITYKLYKKVETIKEFLKKKDPEMLCIQETHTYTKEFKRIQGLFKNQKYDLIYSSMLQ